MDHADSMSQTQIAVSSPVRASRPVLVLLEGPQASDAPRAFRLQATETYLGRGPESAVLCSDPGVSRRHAKVLVTPVGYRLVDLQSRNGTFLNGVRVMEGELQEGDRVQLGPSTVLRFSLRGGEEGSSAARRRAAFKAVPAAIWECRLPDGGVRWSAQVDQVLGFDPGTFVGRAGRLTEFVAVEDRPQVAQALADAAGPGKELNLEFRLAVNGAQRWVACNADVLRDADQRPIRLIGTLTDISGRKRLEEELRKQVALFESLYDGVVMGGLDGRILDWNPSAQAMFGYRRQEAVGAVLFELLGASQPRRLRVGMAQALRGQGRWTAELELRTREGETRWCEIVAVVPPGQEQEPTTCILTHRDVSDRKRLQAQLASSERLASLGTLSAGIAHEINNPLAFILSNLHFLQDQLSGAPPLPGDPLHDECQEILSETRNGAQRIQEIVQGLKVFSREERPDDAGPCDLRAAVELALKLAHSLLRHRVQIEPQLQQVPPVMGGESKWVQLTLNLLMNAVQSIPAEAAEQGRIQVRLQASSAQWVVLEVTDNGVGIAPELRPRLFEPFFTTKAIGAGTGLGLSVCHGIATAAGGSIELESGPSGGSTFRVRIPIATFVADPEQDDTLPPAGDRSPESQ